MARTRVCEGCGCTDRNACIDGRTGEPCYWIEDYDGDLCNLCAETAEAAMMDDLADDAPPADEPLVEVFSPYEAQRYIEDQRAMRAGGAV